MSVFYDRAVPDGHVLPVKAGEHDAFKQSHRYYSGYLRFQAGLAVFMFCGFVKGIPLEIEEAAMIDGCTPLQTFFQVVFPRL